MALFPVPGSEGWLKEAAALLGVLASVLNIGFYVGNRRRLESTMLDHKAGHEKTMENHKSAAEANFNELWKRSYDIERWQRSVENALGTLGVRL